MATANIRIGMAVDCIPTPKPEMIFVAEPVTDCLTIPVTGLVCVPVYFSVTNPMSRPATRPTQTAQKTPVLNYVRSLYVHVSGITAFITR